jgi:hypothetical protein
VPYDGKAVLFSDKEKTAEQFFHLEAVLLFLSV